MNDFIKKLKEDPFVYYIYQTDLSIYGIEDKPYYTVIVDDNGFNSTLKDLTEYGDNIAFYPMKTWFDMMNENTLLVWVCSCLDRKHIIKEYVKLLVPIDILKLRRNILDQLKYSDYQAYPDLDDCINEMIMDVIGLNLTNQIIEHHKIVNLKSPLTSCNSLLKSTDYYTTINKYKEIVNKYLEVLHKFTDDLYKQELIKKHLEDE